MWDISLDFLDYVGISSLKKKKGEDAELISTEVADANQEKDHSGRESPEGVIVCAGCSRILEKGAVRELEKDWCMDCYKSHVLKVKE